MWIPIAAYIDRISAALEEIVAPEISSEYARIQLLAAVELLKSLGRKIEYRRDLIRKRTSGNSSIIYDLCQVVLEKRGDLPEDLHGFFRKLETGQIKQDLMSIEESEAMLRKAIDCLFALRSQFDQTDFAKVEDRLRKFLTTTCIQDVVFVTSDDLYDRDGATGPEGAPDASDDPPWKGRV